MNAMNSWRAVLTGSTALKIGLCNQEWNEQACAHTNEMSRQVHHSIHECSITSFQTRACYTIPNSDWSTRYYLYLCILYLFVKEKLWYFCLVSSVKLLCYCCYCSLSRLLYIITDNMYCVLIIVMMICVCVWFCCCFCFYIRCCFFIYVIIPFPSATDRSIIDSRESAVDSRSLLHCMMMRLLL